MGISPEKSESKGAKPNASAGAPRALAKILHCELTRRGVLLAALLACVGSCVLVVNAQEERPQITPGERKVPRKKDAGPRALAILQIGANGKASLVPVAILVGGKFWDATAYKADPIPMALESGTVYEAERTGSSIGLFTVNSALHSNSANAQTPWLGTGNWVPAGAETKSKELKAESVPAGMDNSDQPPRLTRNPTKEGTPASPAAPNSNTPPPPPPPSDSGDGPPRLTKGTPPPSAESPAGSGQGQTGAAPSKTSGDTKGADAKPEARPKGPESDSGATDANRPMLRRGKPTGPLPDDDVPGYSKPGAVASSNAGQAAEKPDKSNVQLLPAISDATGPEPRSFTFSWLKDEEGERRQQITALAKDQVRAYLEKQAKAKVMPKPGGSPAARRTPAPKVKDPVLENVQMTAYDLWTNNQPVLVLSADAHMPPPAPGAAHSEVDSDLQYSILLVAYPDIYNNLHKIYVGVTDKYHLDITPRLELVDAVDVDGDLRGELLFREISDGGTGWVIYRASQDKLWKMYDSLHPD
jgi:hypothetical protein